MHCHNVLAIDVQTFVINGFLSDIVTDEIHVHVFHKNIMNSATN